MDNNSKATVLGFGWSLIAGGVMIVENPEKIHIFLPDDITDVNVVGGNLTVTILAHRKGHKEAKSYTLTSYSVLPSVAAAASNAGLPIAQYAAAEIGKAKEEQQREQQRLDLERQIIRHKDSANSENQSSSVIRNLVFMIFPIMSVIIFAAMIYYGHSIKHKTQPGQHSIHSIENPRPSQH